MAQNAGGRAIQRCVVVPATSLGGIAAALFLLSAPHLFLLSFTIGVASRRATRDIDHVWLRRLAPAKAWVPDSSAFEHRALVVEA